MSTSSPFSSKIDANDITLSGILDRQKFTIDYFQREYRWERKHMEQLMDDLTSSFLLNYESGHERTQVDQYNSYYMGPLVMSNKEGKLSIIDGQQRLTSLTLLLIFLDRRQNILDDKEPIDTLIYSAKHGLKSYNMQVEEREKCLNALFTTGQYDADDEDESVQNLVERYSDIEETFPEEINDHVLPFFISWLKEKLIFVKIVTYSEENAYTIFETMNDRGMNLTPTEMLKGYLLSKIRDTKKKTELNNKWKKRIGELHEWGPYEDLEFFRTWLRAKYADTIRPGKKGSSNEDFEKIGTTFHSWVKDKAKLLGLTKDGDFLSFVEEKFNFYSKLYLKILNAYDTYDPNLSNLYNISWFGIARSLEFPLLISSINEGDNDAIQNVKLQIVAHFIDCFTVNRSVNQRTLGQSSLRYTLYSLVKEIRDRDVNGLVEILSKKITEFDEDLEGIAEFTLNQQNKRFVRFFLSRITCYIENESGIQTTIDDYMQDNIKKPAQIEHIWADIFDYYKHEFDQKTDFNWYRNTLGDLILLPQGTNQSFNKDQYNKKLPHYLKQNLLAQSLHPDCYIKNPNFTNWYKKDGIPFSPHSDFNLKDLKERTFLYQKIAEKIWSVDKFHNMINK